MSFAKQVQDLAEQGVKSPRLQNLAIDALPCGIKTVRAALDDETLWQVNAPRAILVCYWKGFVAGLAAADENA